MLIPMIKQDDGKKENCQISSNLHNNGGHFGFFLIAFYPWVLLSPSKNFCYFFCTRNKPKHTNFDVFSPILKFVSHFHYFDWKTRKSVFFLEILSSFFFFFLEKMDTIFHVLTNLKKGLCHTKIDVWASSVSNYIFYVLPLLRNDAGIIWNDYLEKTAFEV